MKSCDRHEEVGKMQARSKLMVRDFESAIDGIYVSDVGGESRSSVQREYTSTSEASLGGYNAGVGPNRRRNLPVGGRRLHKSNS